MRRLLLSVGICLATLSLGCEGMINDAFGNKDVRVSGKVKTRHGVPVEGVEVRISTGLPTEPNAVTNSKGYYRTPEWFVKETKCRSVRLYFSKGTQTRDVIVGKCGEQEVNINDWREEG